MLNLYPYNAGHVLICPYRHLADYTELTPAETAEFAEFTKHAVRALRQASGAQGFNIGINLGSVAGAGIAAHLHQHVVPRWGGDTNFMPVTGRTRVLPQLLADTRKLLAEAWPAATLALAAPTPVHAQSTPSTPVQPTPVQPTPGPARPRQPQQHLPVTHECGALPFFRVERHIHWNGRRAAAR